MKRRTFLKTVGGAAGVAALGTISPPNTSAQNQPPPNKSGRSPILTYGREEVTDPSTSSTPTSTLRIRPPFWYADGRPQGGSNGDNTPADPKGRTQLFQEEFIHLDPAKGPGAFPVEFEYKGMSKKWILGGKIEDPANQQDPNKKLFAYLVREIAVRVRKYNASLYTLRRLHFCNKFNANATLWPHANPDGGDVKDPLANNAFNGLRDKAEQDWCDVNDALDLFLDGAKNNGYTKQYVPGKIWLRGSDMIAVNGYIVSMRVVMGLTPVQRGNQGVKEITGSSSHVSISSPFSSGP